MEEKLKIVIEKLETDLKESYLSAEKYKDVGRLIFLSKASILEDVIPVLKDVLK